MQTQARYELSWKIFLIAVILLVGMMDAMSLANWQQVIKPGTAGTVGVDVARDIDANGRRTFRIVSLEMDSPLRAIGARVGSQIDFDTIGTEQRGAFAVGEAIGVTLRDGSLRRHAVIKAGPLQLSRVRQTSYVLTLTNALLALVLSALVGLRRSASISARILALMLLAEATFANQYLPAGVLFDVGNAIVYPVFYGVNYGGFLLFTALFPHDDLRSVPPWERRLLKIFVLFYGVHAVARSLDLLQVIVAPRYLLYVALVALYAAVLLSSLNLIRATQVCVGAARQRVLWASVAFGARFVLYTLVNIPAFSALTLSSGFSQVQIVVAMLSNILLAYGILRFRLFDIGFAINRALVYGIVSVVLLVSFGLLEWLAHHFVSGDEAEKNVLLDATIALGLYLVFHKLRHYVEHAVERLFFHGWQVNEERLRHFVKQAAHFKHPTALTDAYVGALQGFTAEAGCALYRLAEGRYVLAASAGLTLPREVGVDDLLAVALRASMAPVVPTDVGSALPGALALPMSFRGELFGYVLLGAKAGQGAYRPDEASVLEFSAHQIGLDLQALRTVQLHAEVTNLHAENNGLRQAMDAYKDLAMAAVGR